MALRGSPCSPAPSETSGVGATPDWQTADSVRRAGEVHPCCGRTNEAASKCNTSTAILKLKLAESLRGCYYGAHYTETACSTEIRTGCYRSPTETSTRLRVRRSLARLESECHLVRVRVRVRARVRVWARVRARADRQAQTVRVLGFG